MQGVASAQASGPPPEGDARHHYRIHGLTFSCNRPLPACLPTEIEGRAEIRVHHLGYTLPDKFPSVRLNDWKALSRVEAYDNELDQGVIVSSRPTVEGIWWLLSFRHVIPAEFLVAPDGDQVTIYWGNPADVQERAPLPQDIASLLLGPVLGALARRRGLVPLHAGAVAVGGRAILFAGPSGAGKSTLLAAFAASGASLLADDQAILLPDPDGGFHLGRGQDTPRLHPDSLRHFGLDTQESRQVFSIGEKRYTGPTANPAPDDARFVPAAIVLLEPRGGENIRLDRIPAMAAMQLLWKQIYPAFLPLRAEERAGAFTTLADLARRTPLYRLSRPDCLESLPDVCAALRLLVA